MFHKGKVSRHQNHQIFSINCRGVHESGHGHAIPNQMLQQENGVKKTSVGCENFSFDNKEESEKEDTRCDH